MVTRRRTERRRAGKPAAPPPFVATPDGAITDPDDRIVTGPPSLHDLFQQQARVMLDRSDLDEEQKQAILLTMACPCCGAGAMSYTVKLRR